MRLALCRPTAAHVRPWSPEATSADLWDDVELAQADRIVVPWVAQPSGWQHNQTAMDALVASLPGFAECSERYVLLDQSDLDLPLTGLGGAVLLRVSASHRDPGALALPYVVRDPGPAAPIGLARADACFHGASATHPLRDALLRWVRTWKPLEVDVQITPKPFWMLDEGARANLRDSYVASLRASRFVLCPRGRGLNTRRFFEALAHGRIPVLYSDATRLPLEDVIDYGAFCVRVPEGFGRWTPEFLDRFLAEHDLEQASVAARGVYVRYFSPQRFRCFVETVVRAGVTATGTRTADRRWGESVGYEPYGR